MVAPLPKKALTDPFVTLMSSIFIIGDMKQQLRWRLSIHRLKQQSQLSHDSSATTPPPCPPATKDGMKTSPKNNVEVWLFSAFRMLLHYRGNHSLSRFSEFLPEWAGVILVHTGLSWTMCSSHVTTLPQCREHYSSCLCCGMRDRSRRECAGSSPLGSLSDWCQMLPPCCHSTAL